MRVLVAPDSWGGWRSAPWVASEVARALVEAGHQAMAFPLGDGGEGTAEVLAWHGLLDPKRHPLVVRDALGRSLDLPLPRWVGDRGRGFIESAWLLGLPAPEPWRASSLGLGRMLGARRDPAVVGLGGSATVDGGLGLARGLGLIPLDAQGRTLTGLAEDLNAVHRLEGAPDQEWTELELWADVTAPFLESARRFGPQKGLDADGVDRVSAGLERWAEVLARWLEEQGRSPVPLTLPGGGAAGGVGYALACLMGATIVPGAAAVAEATSLDITLGMVDLAITGEGRLDASSYQGKVVGELTERARRAGVQVWGFVGQADGGRDPKLDHLVRCPSHPDREQAFRAALGTLVARLG